jgi:hypothetical protein
MNLEETSAVLGKAAGFDNRTIGQANLLAWHEVLGDLDVRDCLNAIAQHHRESTEYLMPAHVRRIAEKLRTERRDRESRDEQHRQLEAYAATAGPLTDRSKEIRAFVDQVRSALPDGDLEALAPRHEYWRREHQAYQRQLTAEPNPDFDPGMAPVATWQASKHPPAGAWWEDDAKREANAVEILGLAGRLRPRRAEAREAS